MNATPPDWVSIPYYQGGRWRIAGVEGFEAVPRAEPQGVPPAEGLSRAVEAGRGIPLPTFLI